MKAIMAMDKNRVLGLNGKIPWYVKEDFKWFKEFTIGKKLIVGKNTFDTLPKLKDRECLVIVKPQPSLDIVKNQHFVNQNGMTGKLVDFNQIVSMLNYEDLIVIGGAKTYEKFLPHITEFYVTHINEEHIGDTYMSKFEHMFNTFELLKEFEGGHKVIKYRK